MKLIIFCVLCVVLATTNGQQPSSLDMMSEKEQVATMISELTEPGAPRYIWRGRGESEENGPLMSIQSIREIQIAMHELEQCENGGRALNTSVEETPFFAGDVVLNPLRVKGWVEECKNQRRWRRPNGRHHRSKRQFSPQYRYKKNYHYMWPKVNNLYPIHLEVTPEFMNSKHYLPFRQMLKEFERRSCIRPTLTRPPNYKAATIKVLIEPGMRRCGMASDGWCKICKINFLKMSDKRRCKSGVVYHEFMHNLGFLHEHMRSDRDQHVDVHEKCEPVF